MSRWAPALLCLLCAVQAAARGIGRAQEIQLGSATAAHVEQAFRVDRNPLEVARLRRIGARLAACLETSEYAYQFHVVDERDVNAFALPGGYIYVFRGLLQAMPRDDALAFVLAHEICHVSERHALRQFEKSVALAAVLKGVLAGTGAGYGVRQAADVTQAIAGVTFTRADESEADRLGFQLFVRAGYAPAAAEEAMRTVWRLGGDGRDTPRFLRSHPAAPDRVESLRKAATAHAALPTPDPIAAAVDARQFVPPPVESCANPFFPLDAPPRTYEVRGAGRQTTYEVRGEPAAGPLPGLRLLRVEPAGGPAVTGLYRTTGDSLYLRAGSGWRLLAVSRGEFQDGNERVLAQPDETETRLRGRSVIRVERHLSGQLVARDWYQAELGLYRSERADGSTVRLRE